MNISIYAIPGLKLQTKEDVIEQAVCEVFETTPEKIRQKTRLHKVVEPRMMAMYLLKSYTNLGVNAIGNYIGGYHHATVLHAIKTVETLKEVDSIFKRKFNDAHQKIKNSIL